VFDCDVQALLFLISLISRKHDLLSQAGFFSHSTELRGLPLSSHWLAALPAKMSAFNSQMRQNNAYYRNLK